MAYISIDADLDSVFREIDNEHFVTELCNRMDGVLDGLPDYEPQIIKALEIIAKEIVAKAPALLAEYE